MLAATLIAAGFTATACGSSGSPATAAGTNAPTPATTAPTGAPAGSVAPPPSASTPGKAPKAIRSRLAQNPAGGQKIIVSDVSLVARSVVPSISVYATATATTANWTLKNPLPSGAPLVFLVQERRADRLRVLLAVRPNQSQGWVRASDVTLAQHDYRIVVSVGRHTLTLYKAGKVAMQVPVGLGTGSTPTPGGVFYTKELLRPPNPVGAYGTYAYGLSGYSTVLENFGGGKGEIGIHGTNEPASLGKNVSHGCIRMSNTNITKLAGMLPLGVPVQIAN